MTLKTGMLVGIVGTEDIGVLIQVRGHSHTGVIKLNNGTLRRDVPLDNVEEAKDMTDRKTAKRSASQAHEVKASSPLKLAPVAEKAKARKLDVEVGDAIRARCNGGSRWFPGHIIRVHRDGTYDVKYSDGDIEKGMARSDVQAAADEGGDAKSLGKEKIKTGKAGAFRINQSVQARYQGGKKAFAGKITRVHRDETYDIVYDDGDEEKRVKAEYIEARGDVKRETIEDDKPLKGSFSRSKALRVGMKVNARYKKGTRSFPGVISKVYEEDDTYDVEYDDGDLETHVEGSVIEVMEEKDKVKDDDEKKMTLRRWQVGDRVKAYYGKGSRLFPGRIVKVQLNGTYDIKYDDGDSEVDVDSRWIQDEDDPLVKKMKATVDVEESFKVGERVKAKYKKGQKVYAGIVTRVHNDGTFDIKYDDGDVEKRVDRAMIEKQSQEEGGEEGEGEEEGDRFQVGDQVRARYHKGKKMVNGEILAVNEDGTYTIRYEDGEKERKVEAKDMERIKRSESIPIAKRLEVGKRIQARYKRGRAFFPGKITRVRAEGTYDIKYDDGDVETDVESSYIQEQEEERVGDLDREKDFQGGDKKTSGKESEEKEPDSKTKSRKSAEKDEASASLQDTKGRLKKGRRVTHREPQDAKSRRIGIVQNVRFDGTCDVKYAQGETVKKIEPSLLLVCSDSEDSDEDSRKDRRFDRNETVVSNWRRASRLSKPKMTDKWTIATVLASNSDGTYTIRYNDGSVEEDAPFEALKAEEKTVNESEKGVEEREASRFKRGRASIESLFLLEQLALTLYEEGVMKNKPNVTLLRDNESLSSDHSDQESESIESNSKKNEVEKLLEHLFDASLLETYRRMFQDNDVKHAGKLSQAQVIRLVEHLVPSSGPKAGQVDAKSALIRSLLTDWFATHQDLRTHRHFDFQTFVLAFAYVKYRLGKASIEQRVASVLDGRFASFHEHKKQLEVWQEKLGFRVFSTLQRQFHDHAVATLLPAQLCVSKVAPIFHHVAQDTIASQPLDVYLQQQHLLPHHTLLLSEFLCCYYQLYSSEALSISSNASTNALQLHPIGFIASCLFSNGDPVCQRHPELVRRLSVGRTPAQCDLILTFRQAFEALVSTQVETHERSNDQVIATTQLSSFAAKVASDPSLFEPALTVLRTRATVVSLVEIYATCGFLIDEVTCAPTLENALEKLKLRVESSEVRRVVTLVRNLCLKIVRFPHNVNYWRFRTDTSVFYEKIGRVEGASDLVEAVGFVEYGKTHYELQGVRDVEGKRKKALEKAVLDKLRATCVQLEEAMALFDCVESIVSILQRIMKANEEEEEGEEAFGVEECQKVLNHLALYLDNVLKHPNESRYWRIREANGLFQRQIGYLSLANDLMASIGFDLVMMSYGKVYTLRGTSLSKVDRPMESFLWRRKQEIASLLDDEKRRLHDILGFSKARKEQTVDAIQVREAVLVPMSRYGLNAMENLSKTSVQRQQIDMIRHVFHQLDSDHKGFIDAKDWNRRYGTSLSLPLWLQFDAFDMNQDGKIEMKELVAALGPLLDLNSLEGGDEETTKWTVSDLTSTAIGKLRLETNGKTAVSVLGLRCWSFCIN